MKQTVKSIWILTLLIGFSSNLRASDDFAADSIKVAQIVNGFYDWYSTSIKGKKYSDYKPRFVESKNGMTTLDCSTYLENLKAYGFSDSLIIKERLSYSQCIENLEKVKFSDFEKTIYTDLDEYEQANCDFGNYYRWTGGQEPIDGIRIKTIEILRNKVAIVSIEYYEFDSTKNIKHYWGNNILTLKMTENNWLIDKVDSFKL